MSRNSFEQSVKKSLLRAPAGAVPRITITDAGLYVSFKRPAGRIRTIVRRLWPHLAVDLDQSGTVVGIEAIPFPRRFALHEIAVRAGVRLPAKAALRARIVVHVSALPPLRR